MLASPIPIWGIGPLLLGMMAGWLYGAHFAKAVMRLIRLMHVYSRNIDIGTVYPP